MRIEIDRSSADASRCDENLTYSDIGVLKREKRCLIRLHLAGYHAIGTCGERLVELCIITSQLGFCCAYLIFIKCVAFVMTVSTGALCIIAGRTYIPIFLASTRASSFYFCCPYCTC